MARFPDDPGFRNRQHSVKKSGKKKMKEKRTDPFETLRLEKCFDQVSCGMLAADNAHFAISSLRMNDAFLVLRIPNEVLKNLHAERVPEIRSCVLIDIMRRRVAASA
jgi:hypothetical protein